MVDIKEHCYTSNERSTNKNHSKSKSEILWEVKKQPRVTFKQLKTLFVMVTDKPAPHSFTIPYLVYEKIWCFVSYLCRNLENSKLFHTALA